MLKRQQVLLNDWLIEYIRYVSDKYDLSFSEIIRMALSVYFTQVVNDSYPKCKFGIDNKQIIKTMLNSVEGTTQREDLHRLISRIYHEGRKAVEVGLAQKGKGLKGHLRKKK